MDPDHTAFCARSDLDPHCCYSVVKPLNQHFKHYVVGFGVLRGWAMTEDYTTVTTDARNESG